ncbi:uncharacterized protein LOC141655284 [Silene latifolia]|uniref:uncharacterized protein LOC141655284 n=1 Tax=Silene latifolia TaxID=37657 RepID=UPI003D76CB23
MKGGSRAQWQMNNFQAAIDECWLRDVAWEGYAFTFDNGQCGDANRQSMIDRAMCTSTWLELFPYARLLHMEREWFDHAPIKLILDRRETSWGGGEEAVTSGVEKGGGNLAASIKECAKQLQDWKKITIGKIGWAMDKKQRQLARLNKGTRTEEEVRCRRKLVAEIAELNRQEETYWRQRSRALWLRDGDRNTNFFHTRAGERRTKNFIGKLVDDQGVDRIGDEAVAQVVNNYFKDFFVTANPRNFDDVVQGMEGRISDE